MPEFVKQADGQASSDQPTIEIIWDVPATWTEDPSPREMRVTTFFAQVEGHDPAEISLNAFGGDVGGLLANINRWRSQVNLAPIEGAQLIDHVELMDGLGGQIAVVREIGENDMQVLGAAMLPGDGQTWFVKVLAHRDICALIEQDLITFAKSLRPKSLGLDASDPEAGMEISAHHETAWHMAGAETWTWTEPTSSMIAMSFVARSDENVKITVTPLRGEGGGLLPNVNRWARATGIALDHVDGRSADADAE